MRKDLLPGEQVIVVTRPQPRKLILPAAAFILAPAFAAFAIAWIIRGEPARLLPVVTGEWTFWLVAACVLAAAWVLCGYCLPRLLKWHGTRYILTSRRIVARYGVLRRRDQQVSLASLRNVVVSQSLLQRILRSGNISLEAWHQGSTVVPDVPEVATFRNYLLDAIDDLPDGEVFDADEISEALPWDLREGGRDER
ncbi:PH domain-containing protein [Micrococcaceae bacterium Sec5.7]